MDNMLDKPSKTDYNCIMNTLEYILVGTPIAMILVVIALLIKDMVDYPYGE